MIIQDFFLEMKLYDIILIENDIFQFNNIFFILIIRYNIYLLNNVMSSNFLMQKNFKFICFTKYLQLLIVKVKFKQKFFYK